jgi:hypothetical protein
LRKAVETLDEKDIHGTKGGTAGKKKKGLLVATP